jgi:hypothetical protein
MASGKGKTLLLAYFCGICFSPQVLGGDPFPSVMSIVKEIELGQKAWFVLIGSVVE